MPDSQETLYCHCDGDWDLFIFMDIREKPKPVQKIYAFMDIITKNETKVCF